MVIKFPNLPEEVAAEIPDDQSIYLMTCTLADGKKYYGIHVEYDRHTPLTDAVWLQVVAKPIADHPRITYVTIPTVLRIGQYVSLNCTAAGHKVLASGISEAVFTLKNITDKDWGEFLCVANNSAGEDKKSVIIKDIGNTKNTVSPEPETSVTPNSNKKGVSMSTESILYGVIPALLFFLSLVAVASYLIRRKRTRDEENNIKTCEEISISQTTGECFVLTEFRPEMNAITPGSMSNELSRTVVPLRGSERSGHNQDIHVTVIKRPTLEEENKIAMETNEALQRV
ncbi:hypothetical protein OS493_020507 [Desmophyllum pertusum]|uniref:Ig-like domain-containing protein n=1 Tax=Desmophyllum pertusum TaxID=174260 RepID=A0A9W9Z1R2_9CNID|nr:hypothetical protein OS493_020507 [Desmophyllum pertusum]